MRKAAKLTIKGTVQGIFFRQFCKENAEKLNLKGYVRNLENGDVEILIEGEGKDIEQMIELCKKGPAYAQIKNVNVEEKNWSGDLKDFKIFRF
jgi:acylphosphatase